MRDRMTGRPSEDDDDDDRERRSRSVPPQAASSSRRRPDDDDELRKAMEASKRSLENDQKRLKAKNAEYVSHKFGKRVS